MPVSFKWPRQDGRVNTSNGAFAAFGRASEDVTGINWACESLSGKPDPIKGHLVKIFPATGGSGGPLRWVIGLRVVSPGAYRLTVSGTTRSGTTQPQTIDFNVAFTFGAQIDWPATGEDISDYKDDFSPYGSLNPSALDLVTLKDQNGVPVTLLSSTSDPVELQMWTASFDSFGTGTYTLHVEDTQKIGDTHDRLTVA